MAVETVVSETSLFPHQRTSTSSPETLNNLTTRSTRRLDGMKVDIKPLVDRFVIPDLHGVFACKTDLYLLPKQLDEKVASLHL